MPTRGDTRAQFLAGILTTAVEGGIDHWASVTKYRWSMNGKLHGEADGEAFSVDDTSVMVWENEDDNIHAHLVNLATIARGLTLYRQTLWRLPRAKQVILADRMNGHRGDFDAADADMILQLGVFGKVIYG